MMSKLSQTISSIAQRYPGPGGAIAVIHEGNVIARKTWGYASLERRLPFTPASLFRMCSITKQFTCAVMLDRYKDPTVLTPYIQKQLPHLTENCPTVYQLAHNQSGLRDYWAVSMLQGAAIEGSFSDGNSRNIISGTRSLHFPPGTSYSYVNQNFRILSNAMEDESGLSFAELLQHHVFSRANMKRAFLAAETRTMPDSTTGYEGTQETGYRPAINNIYWTGDAGMGASLDDIIAWEQFIDETRQDPNSIYRQLSQPTTFSNREKAPYGFGLQHSTLCGHAVTMHGGALRGWRSHRLHCSDKRISIVVLFNHMSPAHVAASDLFTALLEKEQSLPPNNTPSHHSKALHGTWLDEETGLSARIEEKNSETYLRYLMLPETLTLTSNNKAKTGNVTLSIKNQGQTPRILMERPSENRSVLLTPTQITLPASPSDFTGDFICKELDNATFSVRKEGNILYGGFSGILGEGRMERLTHIADDIWTFPCPRALDHTAPGDWTLIFQREENNVRHVRIGCWLARNLIFTRHHT